MTKGSEPVRPSNQAVRRRFDKRIYIPLPDADPRAHMFKAGAYTRPLFSST